LCNLSEGRTALRKLFTLLIVTFLLLFFFQINVPVKANPDIIIVPDHYQTIQEAINHAGTGDMILVSPGVYNENIIINKNQLTIIGEDGNTTIIDGGKRGTVVRVERVNDFTISGFTIQNSSSSSVPQLEDSGIYIRWGATRCNVSNNIVRDNAYGIIIYESSNNILSSNVVENNSAMGIVLFLSSNNNNVSSNIIRSNDDGIMILDSSWNTLLLNTIANNTNRGVVILDSPSNNLSRNGMSGNKWNLFIRGSDLSDFVHDIDSSNYINGKPVYYLMNQHDLTINTSTFPEVGYLALINSTNVKIENLSLTENNSQGLLFAFTNSSSVKNSIIENNSFGIGLINSFNNVLSNNTVTENRDHPNAGGGIYLASSSYNLIANNNISENDRTGLELWYSSNNSLQSNVIANNYECIRLYDSSANTLSRNILFNNTYGVWLKESSNNIIYNNSFVDNIFYQVHDWSEDNPDVSPSINIWDNGYPSGGNYWSDYTGVDKKSGPNQDQPGSDGIGDTPYIIDANNRDRYPLMPPDKIPPVTKISLNGPVGDNDWFTSDVTVTLSATDNTEVYKTEYSFDRITWTTYLKPFIITTEGNIIVYYKSTDKAGNPESIKTKTIKIDKTIPTCSTTSPSPGSEIKSSTITVTWTGFDATSGISHYEIKMDGGPWIDVGLNITYTFTGVGDGSHAIQVKAFDKAGLSKQDSVEFIVNTSPGTPIVWIVLGIIIAIITIAAVTLKTRKGNRRKYYRLLQSL